MIRNTNSGAPIRRCGAHPVRSAATVSRFAKKRLDELRSFSPGGVSENGRRVNNFTPRSSSNQDLGAHGGLLNAVGHVSNRSLIRHVGHMVKKLQMVVFIVEP